MHLDVFSSGSSTIHRLDPRVKILTFITLVFFCIMCDSIFRLSLYLISIGILILISGLNLKEVLNRVIPANFFILILWLFIPFTYNSNPYLMDLGFLKISEEGIIKTLKITLKCNTIMLATIVFLGTTNIVSLVHTLNYFRVPSKLVLLFFIFYRYLAVMHEEYIKLKRAALARGFVPKTNFHTYKTYGYLVGSLILKSFERSEEIYRAMLARGFRGVFPSFYEFDLTQKDIIVGLILIFLIFTIFIS